MPSDHHRLVFGERLTRGGCGNSTFDEFFEKKCRGLGELLLKQCYIVVPKPLSEFPKVGWSLFVRPKKPQFEPPVIAPAQCDAECSGASAMYLGKSSSRARP